MRLKSKSGILTVLARDCWGNIGVG